MEESGRITDYRSPVAATTYATAIHEQDGTRLRRASVRNGVTPMFAVVFYVPESHLGKVKSALFRKAAGRVGAYECCCWQVRGEGQFRPLDGARPFQGKRGRVEKVPEYRVEMTCQDRLVPDVLRELRRVHPYEEPVCWAHPVRAAGRLKSRRASRFRLPA